MTVQTFALVRGRINAIKGEILAHAVPRECLQRVGRQILMPKNMSDTYIARRFLPYGATSTDANTINRFFANATGNRTNAMVQAHQVQEGVTPSPDSLSVQDTTVVINQYAALYGYSDKTANLYEDDIPAEMMRQLGERMSLVNEQIVYGALQSCTNVFYGGAGTSIATVNGGLTLNMCRRVVRGLQANHAKMINREMKASDQYGTTAVSEGYNVYIHTNLEPDVRNIPGFIPRERYAQGAGKPQEYEIGSIERFRFIGSPDFPEIQDAGATIASTASQYLSTTGTSCDVYPVIVCAQDAFSQLAVRGLTGLEPKHLPPGQIDKADILGQRGYVGAIWWKAVLIENHGWMALLYVLASAISN